MSQNEISTDYLIVGAGPAGASLACFLASHNLQGLLISAANGPARTPRAHLTNTAALECLRDLDPSVYAECLRLGNYGDVMKHYRYCETMAGVEYGRSYAWGYGQRKGEYDEVSPCRYMDLPQSLLEPVLLKWASGRGVKVRFDTKLVDFVEENEGDGKRRIKAKVVDGVSGMEYTIRTKYLFGADGGRSSVAKILDLPFTTIPGGGFAWNILLRADLSHLMQHRQGNLHIILRLEKDVPFIAVARMIEPWTKWMFVIFPKGPTAPNPERSFEEWAEIVKDGIGDPSVEVEIEDVSGWLINETSADQLSKGNVFCLGDAVHRHPPTLGLGSNTCIQDAFNLAWKIAMVEKNLARPSLLTTFNTERQPVASQLVTESNDILRLDLTIWTALGLKPYGVPNELGKNGKPTLFENSQQGREQRKGVREGIPALARELHALGTAMGQLYNSPAIYAADEASPFKPGPRESVNSQQFYDPCTYPGRRVPHAWLNKPIPGEQVSTLDVAGKGKFTLFTGIGGEGWHDAAMAVKKDLGVDINVVGIGYGLDWEDVYLDWVRKNEIEEDGCVLVRPDYFVAWRAQSSGDESIRLVRVMKSILGFDGQEHRGTENGKIEVNGHGHAKDHVNGAN